MAYYAYSNFKIDGETIAPGEKIDQGDMTDEEWQELIDTGAVGEEPIPEDLGTDQSLNQYRVSKALEEMEAAQAGEVVKASKAAEKPANESASSKS